MVNTSGVLATTKAAAVNTLAFAGQDKEGDYNKMAFINPGKNNGMFLAPSAGMPLLTNKANDLGLYLGAGNKPKFVERGAAEGATLEGSVVQKINGFILPV